MKIPLDESSNMLVNFSGKWGESYKHYSYVDVLQSYFAYLSGQKPILDTRYFKEKICIVGLTALGTGDLHPSPFEPLYPGVGIHAEVFNSILNSQFIARASRGTNLAILVILGFLASLSTLKTKPIRGLFALLGSISAFAAISIYLFTLFGVWIDMVWPIFIMASLYVSVTLYKYLVEWKRRLVFENELGIARKIQESFLPKKTPLVKGIDLTAAVFSARQVGGDLYDYLEFGPEKIGVMIGDVSGKGIPASLFMAMVTGSFKFFATEGAKPKDALSNLNAKLLRESASNLFVTIFYAVFDTKLGILTYSNSGHLPLIYSSQGKKVEFLDVGTGAPLGLVEGEYSDGKVNFKEGDIFVFYTDGVTEAMNIKSDMYGKDRLASIIENNRELDSKAILKAIEKDVRRFESKAGQHDDMTIIVTKISS